MGERYRLWLRVRAHTTSTRREDVGKTSPRVSRLMRCFSAGKYPCHWTGRCSSKLWRCCQCYFGRLQRHYVYWPFFFYPVFSTPRPLPLPRRVTHYVFFTFSFLKIPLHQPSLILGFNKIQKNLNNIMITLLLRDHLESTPTTRTPLAFIYWAAMSKAYRQMMMKPKMK